MRPNLSFLKLWNISFGFLGVQIAYALQSANISRIFATLGADPHNLSYFWILPPLMGMIVQPIVGAMSDRTWTRWGRRKPYLFVGALIALMVMIFLPNSGSLGLTIKAAMSFGLFMLILLDTSINLAMQPFKMMVGDMVNEQQKSLAYSIQSFLCNGGSLIGYLFPFFLTWVGVSNVADDGVVPDSVIYSFYIGAVIMILCVLYSSIVVKELPPEEYEKFHHITKEEKNESSGLISLLKHAPRTFWTVGLVQLFCWVAFMYMWTYTNGTIADTVWATSDTKSAAYQEASNWVGVLFAVQAIGSVVWAMVIPLFRSQRLIYALSLLLGCIGFVSVPYLHNQYHLFVSFVLIGCAWSAMLSLPFAILTNTLSGRNMGTYLGLFNCTICLPQIIAATIGGQLLMLLGGSQSVMYTVAGISLLLGALAVKFITIPKS